MFITKSRHQQQIKRNEKYSLKMSNDLGEIDIANRTYYFFDETINLKYLDLNNIKKDEKSYKNIVIYHMVKNLSYVKINSVDPLYFLIDKINRYIKESIGNKYLTLFLLMKIKKRHKSMMECGVKMEI